MDFRRVGSREFSVSGMRIALMSRRWSTDVERFDSAGQHPRIVPGRLPSQGVAHGATLPRLLPGSEECPRGLGGFSAWPTRAWDVHCRPHEPT